MTQTNAPAAAIIDELNFEQAMLELDGLVRALEDGRTPLEQAIKMYERGNQLRQHCEKILAEAQLRIEKIVHMNGKAEKLEPTNIEADSQPRE